MVFVMFVGASGPASTTIIMMKMAIRLSTREEMMRTVTAIATVCRRHVGLPVRLS